MESEARQNPLSKVETIELLQTTIDKLKTIIEQLNFASVVDLPSSNSVEVLITTTEELEKAIAALPQKSVTPESESTPTTIVVTIETPEFLPMPPQKQASASVSEKSAPGTPNKTKPIVQKNVTKLTTKAPKKSSKPKKKKNWIAITIVVLIGAIISIYFKYLSLGLTQQVLSDKVEEIVTEESSLIATKLPAKNSPINEENPVLPEAIEQEEDLTISELTKLPIEDTAIREYQNEPIKKITDVASIALTSDSKKFSDLWLAFKSGEESSLTSEPAQLASAKERASLTTEKVAEFDLQKSFVEEETESITTSAPDLEISSTNIEEEAIIASDASESEEIAPIETKPTSESPSNIDETVALEKEDISEPEPKIFVPENFVAEGKTETLELKTVINDVKLTPEQNLIAALAEKLLQLSQNYQEDIVLSIEPNIANNILIVRITDDWYQLETTEQDEIVADIFTRSQKLEFIKLEIKDQNDNLVARSPVVGQNMIIFRRDSE